MTSFFAQSFEYFSNKPESVCSFLATTRPIFNSSIIPVTLNMEKLWYRFCIDQLRLLRVLALSHTLQFAPLLMLTTGNANEEAFVLDLLKTLIHERRYFCRTLKNFHTGCPAAFELICEHVPSLKTLYCPQSNVVNWQPIARLTSLRELQLTTTPIDDEPLQHLAGLISLEALALARNDKITGIGFAHFSRMKSLRVLNISGMIKLCDEGLLCLPELPSLVELNLAGSSMITDVGFVAVTKQKNLRTIDISDCQGVSWKGLKGLSDLRDLTDLDLSHCRIDDQCLSVLTSIEELSFQRLSLDGCSSVSDEGITMIVSEMKDLVFLDVSRCRDMTDDSLKAISNLKFLEELGIFSLPLISDEGIDHLKNCPRLARIEFGELKQNIGAYSDRSFEVFSQMKSLKELKLYDTMSFTDSGIAKLADSTSLENLIIKGSDVTNDAMLALSKSKSLRMIKIKYYFGPSQVTKEAEQFFTGSKIHFEMIN